MKSLGARICKPFQEPENRFPAWRNRFLGSLNVYKYGHWFIYFFTVKHVIKKFLIFRDLAVQIPYLLTVLCTM
jgi:hypothetical protein